MNVTNKYFYKWLVRYKSPLRLLCIYNISFQKKYLFVVLLAKELPGTPFTDMD